MFKSTGASGRTAVAVLAVFVALAVSASALAADGGDGAQPGDSRQIEQPSASPIPDGAEEIPAERTATSRTYELPNGSRTTQIYELPVNYRDASGHWKPIEEGLEETPGGALVNGDNSFDLRLPARIGDGKVRMSIGEEWISQELLGPDGGAADLQGETASYDAAQAATSFSFSTLANGLKEDIEISGLAAPSTFRFALDASAGLTPSLDDDGSIEFKDADAKTVATLPAPVMYDSSSVPTASDDVHYTLSPRTEAGTWTLSVEADRSWLEQPERAWPVVIDPSILKGGTVAGCSLASGAYETSNYCSSSGWPTLSAWAKYQWYATGKEQYQRALINFDLNSIPTDAYVSAATLGLYAPSEAVETSGAQVRRVTTAWNASTASWKYAYCIVSCVAWKAPGGDFAEEGPEILTKDRGSGAGWWTFSQGLTPLVQSWVANATLRAGMLVKLKDELPKVCSPECADRAIDWNSSAAANPETRPYLSVTYWPQVPAAANAKVISPVDGTKTAKRLKLQASWSSGITSITWLYREGKIGFFKEIPAAAVRDSEGKAIGSWPVSAGSSPSKPLFLDATQLSPTLQKKGGSVQVRPLFEGGKDGVGAPVETKIDPALGGPKDATAPVGPGSVDLLTGNFMVSKTDVSIPTFNSSLDFSRTFNSRDTGEIADTGVLGRGWKPGVPVEENGAGAWRSIKFSEEAQSIEGQTYTFAWATAIGIEGAEIPFEREGTTYKTPDELPGWTLTKPSSSQFTLTTPDGTKTTFTNSAGSPNEYLPTTVSQTGGSSNSTRMEYEVKEGNRRLVGVTAPAAPGIDCSTAPNSTPGCKRLQFAYEPASKWGAPSHYGDRLYRIWLWTPGFTTSLSQVAEYSYDFYGRLKEAWDPRVSPALKETYTYGAGGVIATITPPGLKPWTMNYGTLNEEEQPGRLLSVERDSLVEGMAKTTIAYGVPLSGSGLPSMMPADVAEWGQSDAPLDATAIFPPDQVPASPPTSYSRATIYYMDGDGYAVNTSTPAGGGTGKPSISTSETDRYGNVVRELTPQNRVRALAEGTGPERIARSHELETRRLYEDEGTEMAEEIGPVHPVRIQEGALAGELVDARLYRHVDYDQVKEGETLPTPAPHLPTTEKTAAMLASNGSLHDERINKTEYNWSLRKPTRTIVDAQPGGLNLESVTAYDASTGLPTETRQPSNPGGGGAGTTKFIYYRWGNPTESPCADFTDVKYAGLPCIIEPAAQPGTSGQPQVKATRIASYNQLGRPTEVWEAPGKAALEAGTPRRTTVTTYDSAGRPLTLKRTGGGTTVPMTKTEYSLTTGLPTTQKFDCTTGGCEGSDDQAVSTVYDALGRATEYTDADGNTSTVTYDLLGRPVTTDDGKGTQTRTYDPTSGLLVELEDSAAGTFTAAYDADGKMVEEVLPNGLVAEQTYDEAGQLNGLAYDQAGSKWLDFDAERSISGQILKQKSLTSRQEYSYDKAGRLVKTKDWNAAVGGKCTTREYAFGGGGYEELAGKNSNRTKMLTRPSGFLGSCATSGGSEQKYEYDTADRLKHPGIEYDDYGRIKNLPAELAGGQALLTSYFSTDMVASQTQDGVTNTFQLDAALRQRQRTQGGGLEGVEVFHYAGVSDTPAWTQLGTEWSRNISGIGGSLAAIQDSSSGTVLQLSNMHGDIVATASLSMSAAEPEARFDYDEFGVPKQTGSPHYGWLGGKGRRTEFASGVIQMGARSYVPAIGRFISVDPIRGGSANAYDYTNADPVNGFDLAGTKPHDGGRAGSCAGSAHIWSPKVNSRGNRQASYGQIHLRYRLKCVGGLAVNTRGLKIVYRFNEVGRADDPIYEKVIKFPEMDDKEIGNWSWGKAWKYTCLLGVEYEYNISFVYEWSSPAGVIAGKGGKGGQGESAAEPGGGSIELSVQEYCGHGKY